MKTQTSFFSVLSLTLLLFISNSALANFTQPSREDSTRRGVYISIETDPAFWFGVLPQGPGIDANIDIRLKRYPRWRLGILGYSGKWAGAFGQQLLLTSDFRETDWTIQWNGLGAEAHFRFEKKRERGGFFAGTRVQWNQFTYRREVNQYEDFRANHFVVTPQVGYQWFPFQKAGFYLLPWAGIQVPLLGTRTIDVNGQQRSTRKTLNVFTAHIGWEFGR